MAGVPWPAPPARTVVMIGGNDVNFHTRVAKSLAKLNATVAGNALLTALADRRAGVGGRIPLNVGINDAANNQCAGIPVNGGAGSDGRTLLAQALIDSIGNIPAEIAACLAAMGQPGNHAWLANAVNMTPVYNIMGMPAGAPSAFGLTAAHVQDWINGVTIFPAPFTALTRNNLTLLLLTVLWPGSRTLPGTGLHSRVSWNPASRQITLTTGVVLQGSKTVSLAHELTHALYNGEGQQLGIDNTHFSTVLFEYMTVGLGPWAAEQCSENQYRAQWAPALLQRPCY